MAALGNAQGNGHITNIQPQRGRLYCSGQESGPPRLGLNLVCRIYTPGFARGQHRAGPLGRFRILDLCINDRSPDTGEEAAEFSRVIPVLLGKAPCE